MTKGHVEPGETINLYTLNESIEEHSSIALVKTTGMEVIRMVIPKGRKVAEHSVRGEISVQCLKGEVQFKVGNKSRQLSKGDWLYLNGDQLHSLRAKEDTVLLVTILFLNK